MQSSESLILVVDDERSILQLISLTLRKAAYRTMEAESAEAALKLVQDLPCKPDVLITDLELPGMSGPQLASRFSSLYPLTKILFVSGSAPESALRLAAGLLPFPFLAKPLNLNELRQSVEILLNTERARTAVEVHS